MHLVTQNMNEPPLSTNLTTALVLKNVKRKSKLVFIDISLVRKAKNSKFF